MPHPCNCECSPLQAQHGFVIGSKSCNCDGKTDALTVYTNWAPFQPITDGLVANIGSWYKQVGDQVHLNINLTFLAPTVGPTFVVDGLPLPIKFNSIPSNSAILQHGIADPNILIPTTMTTTSLDVTTITITSSLALVVGDPYVLNAQIVYSTKV